MFAVPNTVSLCGIRIKIAIKKIKKEPESSFFCMSYMFCSVYVQSKYL